MVCDPGDYIAPGAGWQSTNSNFHTKTGKLVFLWLCWLCFVSTVVCTTFCNKKTRRKMEWVFVLLITGQVFTNPSQFQIGGQIHVPNYVCSIEPNLSLSWIWCTVESYIPINLLSCIRTCTFHKQKTWRNFITSSLHTTHMSILKYLYVVMQKCIRISTSPPSLLAL